MFYRSYEIEPRNIQTVSLSHHLIKQIQEKQFVNHIQEQIFLVLIEIEYRTSRLRDILFQFSD